MEEPERCIYEFIIETIFSIDHCCKNTHPAFFESGIKCQFVKMILNGVVISFNIMIFFGVVFRSAKRDYFQAPERLVCFNSYFSEVIWSLESLDSTNG
jgi:hypothetical protein